MQHLHARSKRYVQLKYKKFEERIIKLPSTSQLKYMEVWSITAHEELQSTSDGTADQDTSADEASSKLDHPPKHTGDAW